MTKLAKAVSVVLVALFVAGCGGGSKTAAPAATEVPSTTVDQLTADTAAIKTMWRSLIDGANNDKTAFYQSGVDAAYPVGGWDMESITCTWRTSYAKELGEPVMTVDEWLKLQWSKRPPQFILDAATIEATPGWVLAAGATNPAFGHGSVPDGRIYVMNGESDGVKKQVHATVIDGKAYDFPHSCTENG